MSDQNQWYQVLAVSREIGAGDLKISNDILEIVDELVKSSEKNELTEDKVAELSKKLVNLALSLTDQSSKISTSISKLAGIV